MGPQGSGEELEAARRMRDLLVAGPATHRFQDAPDFQGGTLEEDQAFLLGRLLRTLRARLESGLPPKQTRYAFAHTDSWEHIRRKAEAALPPPSEG